MPRSIIVIAHNIRSTHNIGALLRTADGLGIDQVILSGYSPYPRFENDGRLPHEASRTHRQISKTALGVEMSELWIHDDRDITTILKDLRKDNYTLIGLEQTDTSLLLPDFKPPGKLAMLLGSEVTGIDQSLLYYMDICVEIPMSGHKESFNVVEAASMAMYHFRYFKG